jgi:TolA-binding protein
MQNGEVRVLGDGSPRQVHGGETLRLPSNREPAREASLSAPTPVKPAPSPAAVADLSTVSKSASAPAKPSAAPVRTPEADWSALLNAGQFSAIIRDADARGGERLLDSVSAKDLKVLALAARYTGRRTLSLRAWQTLRTRYAADALNNGAAFFLGRSYEEQGEAAEALRWHARYLAESPNGAYASEALGRRLLLLSKSGQRTEAVSTARTYLERYPRGAYAKSAQLVIQPE